jgi:D-alanine-D-alanine ligase
MKIAVFCGGISTERNVSLASGKAVYNSLQKKGHDVILIDPVFGSDKDKTGEKFYRELLDTDSINETISSFNTIEALSKMSSFNYIDCVHSDLLNGVDCAFIVLHGKYGEDGRIQSLLELRGTPYTGSGARSSSIAMDKLTSKIIFSAHGIVTPP